MGVSNFDEGKLRELLERMNRYARPVNVPVDELFPDAFIQQHTDLPDAASVLAMAGVSPNGGNGGLETECFAEAVRVHTAFPGPAQFLQEATANYLRRKLGVE
jgi:hypothetical protein